MHPTLPAGTGYTSLDLSTRFLRLAAPVQIGSGASERFSPPDRGPATAQARIFDGRDRLLAHATSTCLIFPIGAATCA